MVVDRDGAPDRQLSVDLDLYGFFRFSCGVGSVLENRFWHRSVRSDRRGVERQLLHTRTCDVSAVSHTSDGGPTEILRTLPIAARVFCVQWLKVGNVPTAWRRPIGNRFGHNVVTVNRQTAGGCRPLRETGSTATSSTA